MPEYPNVEAYEPDTTPDYSAGEDKVSNFLKKTYESLEQPRLQEQLKKMKRIVETKLLENFVEYVESKAILDTDLTNHIESFLDERSKPE